jgi:type 2 lantibiotic biosynthesis protein LanM
VLSFESDFAVIVQQASSISERLKGDFLPTQANEGDNLLERRLERWRKLIADEDQEHFQKRLVWDGLDLEAARRSLRPVCSAEIGRHTAWANTLGEFLEFAASQRSLSVDSLKEERCLDPDDPIPFEEILVPFVRFARRKVRAKAGPPYERLTPNAHTSLERSLLQSLAAVGSQTLELEFSIVRAQRQSHFDRLIEQSSTTPSRYLYNAFLDYMLDRGLLLFFREYAVLARLLSTLVATWIDATLEFLERLASDLPGIEAAFRSGAELGQVVEVEARLSDPHRNGRSVCTIAFESGLKLVYKPRAIQMEAAFFQLLDWLNAQGMPYPLKVLTFVDRGSYGWVEFVEQLPCDTVEEARRYYQRVGVLLGLLYTLEGTDFHYENIVAHGEHPVLIDVETLFSSPAKEDEQTKQDGETALWQFWFSVLKTGLLPRWQTGPNGETYDVSGLGSTEERKTSYLTPEWRAINTDHMVLVTQHSTTRPVANVPSLDGTALSPNDYCGEIVDGFRYI